MARDNRKDPTNYAVICEVHGLQFLKHREYMAQLALPNQKWRCPLCGRVAEWDDDCRETNPPE